MDSVILVNEAIKLPAWERVQIIDRLWKSLDEADQAAIDAEWLAESHDRLRAYHAGEVKVLDGEEALREIENGL